VNLCLARALFTLWIRHFGTQNPDSESRFRKLNFRVLPQTPFFLEEKDANSSWPDRPCLASKLINTHPCELKLCPELLAYVCCVSWSKVLLDER